jgi:hypothetical protein
MKTRYLTLAIIVLTFLAIGCVGRTGKVGKPISAYYETQLASLKLGVSTPDDLKNCFTITVTNGTTRSLQPHAAGVQPPIQTQTVTTKKVLVSLKEASIENGKKVEIYEVTKGGGMDVAAFVMWGYVAYNKDQELLFRFEDGKLISYESVVLPDPEPATATPVTSPKTPAARSNAP